MVSRRRLNSISRRTKSKWLKIAALNLINELDSELNQAGSSDSFSASSAVLTRGFPPAESVKLSNMQSLLHIAK